MCFTPLVAKSLVVATDGNNAYDETTMLQEKMRGR